MKNKFESRRGSALLIVLGMLSFMVVSAVGFSVYMRQGRAPSSYLSRNVSSRYLVKAALASAIEELDCGFMSQYDIGISSRDNPDNGYLYGIYDDPYPGIGSQSSESFQTVQDQRTSASSDSNAKRQMSYTRNGNFWFKRVFCPFGLLGYPGNEKEALARSPQSVPTLTLEALAYLPPAIIDDVRKVSRLTRTAEWKSLPYEAGRYAYTAVNVSDLFDINRLRASEPRNSGPDRITLGALCAQSEDQSTTVDDNRADALDTILEKVEQNKIGGSIVPFISLADFNLAAIGSNYAPLMKYIGAGLTQLPQSAEAANAMFVTDTWFPATNVSGQVTYDLAGGHQPWTDFTAQGFLQVGTRVNTKDNVGQIFLKNLGIGLVSLYDYLDSDNVPMSLALPTVEAVPMVVGVSSPTGLKPSFGSIGNPDVITINGLSGKVIDANGDSVPVNDISITRTCQLKGITGFGNRALVKVVTCYPFKRMKTTQRTKSFSVRGLLRIYFAPADMNCRVSDRGSLIHPKNADWKNSVANGVATFVSNPKTITAFSANDVKTTEEAIDDSLTLDFSSLNCSMPLYWEIKEENPTSPSAVSGAPEPDSSNFKKSYLSLGKLKSDNTAFRPLTADGSVNTTWENRANGSFDTSKKYGEANGIAEIDLGRDLPGTYRLYASVWVQVLDGSQVVEMVPATVADDGDYLSRNVPDNGVTQRVCGDGAPTLNFMNTVDFTYETASTALDGKAPDFKWNALYTVDPRYNYAPENWFATTASGATKNEWMSELGLSGSSSTIFGREGRDADIFMFVSDQEYLQSMGELQFLPALHDFDGNATFPHGDLPNLLASGGHDSLKPFSDRVTYAASKDKFVHRDFFWRTYTAYQTEAGTDNTSGTDWNINPYKLKQVGMGFSGPDASIVSGIGCFKLNPFSDDIRVLNAAIVGTPFDYYVASTNDNQRVTKNQLIKTIDYATMMSTYSFGKSNVAKMSDDDLADICDEIRDTFSGMTSFDMNSAWGKLKWQIYDDTSQINDNNKKFLANDLTLSEPLHSVDRKYLYSFWRDCFANQQQLFLIFVRAEPSTIGGGAAGGVSSAQLGSRAVALVWRDPSVPSGTTGGKRKTRRSITTREQFRELKKDQPPHRTRVLFYHQFD